MRFSIAFILVVAATIASAVGTFMGLQMKPELLGLPPVRVAPAKADPPTPPVLSRVTSLGRIEPASEYIGVSAPPGGRIESMHVKEHQHIKAGDLIATLDTHEEVEAARDHAKELLDEATKRYDVETTHAQTIIELTKLKVRDATEVTLKGIEAQEAMVRRAELELEKAKKDLNRSSQMLKDKALPQSQFDTSKLAVRSLDETILNAKASLAQLISSRDMRIALAKAELKSAEADLPRIQKMIPLDSLKAQLKLAESRLPRTVVRAPIDGEVLKVNVHAGETPGAQPLIKLADTSQMFVIAEIYETDVYRVKVGQRAHITSKAFAPDVKLEGKVESISSMVHKKDVLSIDPAADADARVIETKIRLNDSTTAAHYNNMQVDVTVQVGPPERASEKPVEKAAEQVAEKPAEKPSDAPPMALPDRPFDEPTRPEDQAAPSSPSPSGN
jgi:HlyD family secretion protein